MGKDGVRQRKPMHKDNNGGGGDSGSDKPRVPAPSSAGMTCFNWFVVLFLIIGVSGGASFFIYQEMTLTNRAILRELQLLKQDSSGLSSFADEAKLIKERIKADISALATKLNGIEQAQIELHKVKEGESSEKIDALSEQMTETQKGVKQLRAEMQASSQEFAGVKEQLEMLKASQSAGESKDTAEALKHINEKMEVANTNIKYLSEEVLRMDKNTRLQFEQFSSVQKDVIDLTADKMIAKSAIESMKSTVVAVRERVEKLESGGGSVPEGDGIASSQKFQEFEKRTTDEISRLSREISETSENSAIWLQQSTDSLSKRFQLAVDDITKQFNEVKVGMKEPTHATENESLINSLAFLDRKTSTLEATIENFNEKMTVTDGKHEAREKSYMEQLEIVKRELSSITTHVRSVKETEDKMLAKMDALSGDVTTATNDINRLSTTARILEGRVGAIQSSNEKLDEAVQGILGKEAPAKEPPVKE